jgi:hypothetical protein
MYQYTVTIDNYLKINEYLWIYDNYQHLLIDILIHIQMRYILKWKMYRRIHIRYRLSLKTFDLFCRYKTLTFIMKTTKLNIFFKYPKAFLKFHFFCIFIFVAKKKVIYGLNFDSKDNKISLSRFTFFSSKSHYFLDIKYGLRSKF